MELSIYDKFSTAETAITTLGNMFAGSGMFGCTSKSQGEVLAMMCLCKRKDPDWILRNYHIVDGKLSKKSSAILADFRAQGGRHKWIETGEEGALENRKATIQLSLDGDTVTYTFSYAMAKAQGLVRQGSGWTKVPGNMLRARAITNGIGLLAPEITAGTDDDVKSGPVTTVSGNASALLSSQATPESVVEVVATPTPAAAPAKLASSDDLVMQLEVALEPVMDAAVPWLRSKKWIPADGELSDLSATRAQRIIGNPEKAVAVISEWAEQQVGGAGE